MLKVHSFLEKCLKINIFSRQIFRRQNKKLLELERKFWYDFDIEKKLVEENARKINQNLIVDEYFDNLDTNFLLLNDFLLRNRRIETSANKWQLKYPSRTPGLSSNIENYFETENVKQMSDLIKSLSDRNFKIDNQDINSLINVFDLKCYAKITSNRKTYLLDNVRIDLDETDFNYKLGEIEMILDDDSNHLDIEKSIQKISNITDKLGNSEFN